MTNQQNTKNKEHAPVHLIELMPQDHVSQQILTKRAKHLAKPTDIIQDNKQDINYVRFILGENELYGIPYNYIKEVIMYTPPTKVPYTAEYIAGIINRHGALISVLDLKHLFHLKSTPDDKGAQFIVVSIKGTTIALLVNSIDGSDKFNSEALCPPLQLEGAVKPQYIQGLHKSTIAIINIEALITDLQTNNMHIKESMS